MPNQKSTFIPVVQKPAKSTSSVKGCAKKRAMTTQTDPVILVKEENLNFFPASKMGNDGGMKRDYIKAVNYINSCHKFINSVMEKNNGSTGDKSSLFLLPSITNFAPLFPFLVARKAKGFMTLAQSKIRDDKKALEAKKIPERNKISATKSGDAPATPKKVERKEGRFSVVGDAENKAKKAVSADKADCLANMIKDQINEFLSTLQKDLGTELKKTKSVSPREQNSKNLDIVKQKLEDLSKLCHLKRDLGAKTQIFEISHAQILEPSTMTSSETDCEATKAKELSKVSSVDSVASLISESSDIKSDSDLEINVVQ